MPRLTYSKDMLMNIGKGVINTFVQRPFTPNVWKQLKELNIVKQTKRGYRGGRLRRTFTIPTHTTTHRRIDSLHNRDHRTVSELNLTRVPTSSRNFPPKVVDSPKSCLATWNAESLTKKTTSIADFITDNGVDLLGITESWLNGDHRDDHPLADLGSSLPYFQVHHLPRTEKRGGGIFLLSHKGIDVKENEVNQYPSFEYMDFFVKSPSSSPLRLLVIYRPPPSKYNHLTPKMFFKDFSTLLESISIEPARLAMVGDLNFHFDVSDDRDANTMRDLLDSAGLEQHVTEPTHRCGHTLDVIITRKADDLISNIKVFRDLPSTHYAVKCNIAISRPRSVKQVVHFRELKKINISNFQDAIKNSYLFTDPPDDLSDLVTSYEQTLGDLLEKHAPLKSKSMVLRPNAPWYDESLRSAKQEKRRHERTWMKFKQDSDRQVYTESCKAYTRQLEQAKRDYHRNKISECDDRQLFRLVDGMTRPTSTPTLPSHDDAKQLANEFGTFFQNKINKLKTELVKFDSLNVSVEVRDRCVSEFNAFSTVTEEDVRNIISSSAIKTCPLDPIPSSLLKDCLDPLLPSITRVVNKSLTSGEMPQELKTARVVPLLKKSGLDTEELKNYRPISNLKFMFKTIEKVASSQLNAYLEENNLHAPMQSAYRKYHSTETALLRVQNDLLCAVDQHQEAVLILLDFSAAFDLIDHEILLQRLRQRYGIKRNAFKWFSSYLKGRTQCIDVRGATSAEFHLDEGVPQGSVMGPLIFTMYTAPMGDIIASHDLDYMFYADDSQVYLVLDPSKLSEGINKVEMCASDIKAWAVGNNLMLNDSKTEVIHLSSRFVKTIPLPALTIGEAAIEPSAKARNLGVIIDNQLVMKDHVKSLTRSASFAVYKIGQISKYLDSKSTERLVHAFVTSRLDCCNSLLFGLPKYEIAKLQRIQNSAARLVSRAKYRDHMKPVLHDLHWLPIEQRIVYKVLLITFKVLQDQAPSYLKDLINRYQPIRSLRSSSQNLLSVPPKCNTMSYGERAFCNAAPVLWNKLPAHVRSAHPVSSFKRHLKTHLFTNAFSDF
jgi:hypothetical protein